MLNFINKTLKFGYLNSYLHSQNFAANLGVDRVIYEQYFTKRKFLSALKNSLYLDLICKMAA